MQTAKRELTAQSLQTWFHEHERCKAHNEYMQLRCILQNSLEKTKRVLYLRADHLEQAFTQAMRTIRLATGESGCSSLGAAKGETGCKMQPGITFLLTFLRVLFEHVVIHLRE